MKYIFLLSTIFVCSFLYTEKATAEPNCSGAYDATDFYDFKESCFKHDVCYSEAPALGFKKSDCDNRFYADMKASCRGRSFLCEGAAKTYYLAVSNSYFKEAFKSAGKKGQRILDGISQTNDVKTANLLRVRAQAQTDWINLNVACSKLNSDKKFKACKKERDSIVVPDIPMKYAMGNCNILGVNWKHGSRTLNSQIMADKLGVPISECKSK